jgi:hypothetical protein
MSFTLFWFEIVNLLAFDKCCRKKHRKPGQNRKRTGPAADQSFSGFAPAFDASLF